MARLEENIAEYLETEGFGTRGTDIFVGFTPDDEDGVVDDVIAVNQTGGVAPDIDLPIAKPTVEVIVRNSDYNAGFDKLTDIFNRFHAMHDDFELVEGGVDVMRVFAMNEVQPLGSDSKERYSFTCTFVFQLRR